MQIEKTLLGPDLATPHIWAGCEEMLDLDLAVCVTTPNVVGLVHERLPDIEIVAAIGWPWSSDPSAARQLAAAQALEDGATQLEVFLPTPEDQIAVQQELRVWRHAFPDVPLRVAIDATTDSATITQLQKGLLGQGASLVLGDGLLPCQLDHLRQLPTLLVPVTVRGQWDKTVHWQTATLMGVTSLAPLNPAALLAVIP